ERVHELAHHRGRQRIALVGPVERDARDALPSWLVAELGVGHRARISRRSRGGLTRPGRPPYRDRVTRVCSSCGVAGVALMALALLVPARADADDNDLSLGRFVHPRP